MYLILVTKSEGVGLIVRAISFQDFLSMWSQITNVTDRRTDGRTDGRHAIPRPRICTKVHCAVTSQHSTERTYLHRGEDCYRLIGLQSAMEAYAQRGGHIIKWLWVRCRLITNMNRECPGGTFRVSVFKSVRNLALFFSHWILVQFFHLQSPHKYTPWRANSDLTALMFYCVRVAPGEWQWNNWTNMITAI